MLDEKINAIEECLNLMTEVKNNKLAMIYTDKAREELNQLLEYKEKYEEAQQHLQAAMYEVEKFRTLAGENVMVDYEQLKEDALLGKALRYCFCKGLIINGDFKGFQSEEELLQHYNKMIDEVLQEEKEYKQQLEKEGNDERR